MNKFLSVLFVLLVVNISAQSDLREVALSDFSGLKVVGQIVVELKAADDNSATIEMVKGKDGDLVLRVGDDGVLKIGFESKSKAFFADQKAKVTLRYKSLNLIKSIAGSKINSQSAIVSDKLTLLCSGGGYMNLVLKVEHLDAVATAGSTIILSGDAHTQQVKSISGSKYEASKLYSNTVNAKSLSGSSLNVWVTEEIVGRANSGGKLSYKGNPKKEEISGPRAEAITKL